MPVLSVNYFIQQQASLAARIAASNGYGRQIYLRYWPDDPTPTLLWALVCEGEASETSLRDGEHTGLSTAKIMIPRQPGFEPNEPLQPGMLVEKELGSCRWWMVDKVTYCGTTPDEAAICGMELSWTDNDYDPD